MHYFIPIRDTFSGISRWSAPSIVSACTCTGLPLPSTVSFRGINNQLRSISIISWSSEQCYYRPHPYSLKYHDVHKNHFPGDLNMCPAMALFLPELPTITQNVEWFSVVRSPEHHPPINNSHCIEQQGKQIEGSMTVAAQRNFGVHQACIATQFPIWYSETLQS